LGRQPTELGARSLTKKRYEIKTSLAGVGKY
jgi:hypothetical protein